MRKILSTSKGPSAPVLRMLYEKIDHGAEQLSVNRLHGSANAFLIAALSRKLGRPMVVLSPTEKEARQTFSDLSLFLGGDKVFLYPPWDIQSIDMFALQREVELVRMEVLARLLADEPAIIVAPLKALMQKVVPRSLLDAYLEIVTPGSEIPREDLVAKLIAGGYQRTTLVEEKGEFSLRGHVLDLFPPMEDQPLRLEFDGDDLESLRAFDPASQRSTGRRDAFVLCPAREVILSEDCRQQALRNIHSRAKALELPRTVREHLSEMIDAGLSTSLNPLFLPLFYESLEPDSGAPERGISPKTSPLGSFFDYLPGKCLIVMDDALAIENAGQSIENEIDRCLLKARREEKFYLEREASYVSKSSFLKDLRRFQRMILEGLALDRLPESHPGAGADSTPSRAESLYLPLDTDPGLGDLHRGPGSEDTLLSPLIERIRPWLQSGMLVTIFCSGKGNLQRMHHLLEDYELTVRMPEGLLIDEALLGSGPGALSLREGRLSRSFLFSDLNLAAISEEELFGKKIAGKRVRSAREGYFLRSFGDLKEGDYVVHKDHGIGLYQGMQKLNVGGIENDFLLLGYQSGDKLYLPVDRLDQISRYIGPDNYIPKVDRLGGTSWDAVRERVKKSIREVAEELVAIYAAREIMERRAFAPPDAVYEEFCAAFSYDETPDQARAIEDIHNDMNSAKPMDRLICGDAGFGKTEVAMRAAFRTVMDGRQVAVLVPTTILAEQHFSTFVSRMKDYPIRIEALNRFRNRVEQSAVLDGLRRGQVDIVIGTHRLLSKDVTFKNLGLVVIDEEQRFGVSHKEKLKKLRTLVDVLTLSATPIPRTLHLSLVGIRDLSIINTPPEDRQTIRTYVLEFNEEIIRDAIRNELARQGQVFFLHDRVKSIYTMARLVEKLVPEAEISVVHGQMKPREIEDAMGRFLRRECNVLVCTTIVGSGLDIPTANTMLINRADRFGLAQLYQIRGRVGRSSEEAFAYLLVPKGVLLSRDAQKRLQVIMDFSEPGSGFRIASSDMEIRGGGNLLGTSQSGHVSAVGYELYTELMEKTIREIKGEAIPEEEIVPEIHMGLPAYIPEEYMADVHRRLVTYKRISTADSDEELEEIREELADCFGYLPPEVANLLGVIRLRSRLKGIRARKMGYDSKQIFIFFSADTPVEPDRILALARRKYRGLRLTPDYKLYIPLPGLQGQEILSAAGEVLRLLS
ncbi:transcription-repair coupling factor [Syntrophus buswellii]|uniref:transcription-repair coupling factor n=1 Tax=Syntrophus TaxID=43773 RepID=UPI00345E3272